MGARREGEFEGLFGDTIGLIESSTGLHRRIPLPAIESIDRPTRTTTSIGRGAGRGLLLGALAGAVIGVVSFNRGNFLTVDRPTAGVMPPLDPTAITTSVASGACSTRRRKSFRPLKTRM